MGALEVLVETGESEAWLAKVLAVVPTDRRSAKPGAPGSAAAAGQAGRADTVAVVAVAVAVPATGSLRGGRGVPI